MMLKANILRWSSVVAGCIFLASSASFSVGLEEESPSVLSSSVAASSSIIVKRKLQKGSKNNGPLQDSIIIILDDLMDEPIPDDDVDGEVGIETSNYIRVNNRTPHRSPRLQVDWRFGNPRCQPDGNVWTNLNPNRSARIPRPQVCRDRRVSRITASLQIRNQRVNCRGFNGPSNRPSFSIVMTNNGQSCRVVESVLRDDVDGPVTPDSRNSRLCPRTVRRGCPIGGEEEEVVPTIASLAGEPPQQEELIVVDNLHDRRQLQHCPNDIPDCLRQGLQCVSGFTLDCIRVHYNSASPRPPRNITCQTLQPPRCS